MIPRGWKIERQADVIKTIHITAPNGYVASVSSIDRNPANVLYMLADTLLNGTDAEIYGGIAASYAAELQGGLSNDELLSALQSKLPGVQCTDRDLTMFALGVEVGAAGVATGDSRRTDMSKPCPICGCAAHHICGHYRTVGVRVGAPSVPPSEKT